MKGLTATLQQYVLFPRVIKLYTPSRFLVAGSVPITSIRVLEKGQTRLPLVVRRTRSKMICRSVSNLQNAVCFCGSGAQQPHPHDWAGIYVTRPEDLGLLHLDREVQDLSEVLLMSHICSPSFGRLRLFRFN
jgi:hypothetical protein